MINLLIVFLSIYKKKKKKKIYRYYFIKKLNFLLNLFLNDQCTKLMKFIEYLIDISAYIYIICGVILDKKKSIPFPINIAFLVISDCVNELVFLTYFFYFHTIRLIFLSFPEPSNSYYENYNNCIVDPISRILPYQVSFIRKYFPLFTVPPKTRYYFMTKYENMMAITWVEILYLILKHLTLFSFSYVAFSAAQDAKVYLNQKFNKFLKYTIIIFMFFLIMHDWVLCECPYYEIMDYKLSIYKDLLYMTFVGPPFTDNENWSFHPFQTLFDISTYKNICYPIFKGDFKSIFYGIVRFIPRLFKRLHPKPFDKIFICFSISIPISIIIFIISMVLFDSNDDNSSRKKNKKQKKNSKKSNKGKKNVESSKSIPNKEHSLYDSPCFSDFHYPILCNDQKENDSILSNIYVVPKSLNKILGGSITIQTMSK